MDRQKQKEKEMSCDVWPPKKLDKKMKQKFDRPIKTDALMCRSRLIRAGYKARIDSDSWCVMMANRLGLV
jgi:metal-responsive CopG/Arc/MetJ family transcriptional regulator